MKNTAVDKKGRMASVDISFVKGNISNSRENQHKLQLDILKKHNACLEGLVEQQTKKIEEIVASNTSFISIIAHDLRSPLTSIIGILDLLKEGLMDNNQKETETYLDLVSEAADRTLTLFDNLLVWAISQNRGQNINPVKINLYELLVDELMNDFTHAKLKQIRIKHSIRKDLYINADVQMVKTILRNLISNAIKYTGINGVIRIRATEKGPFIEIAISDNGVGIMPEVVKNLFKDHAFLSASRTGSEHGFGLGLIFCKEFVELHGGAISVVSKPGIGSSFKFTLPHYIKSIL